MLSELLISSLCLSNPTLHQEACNKGMVATSISLNVKQPIDETENFLTNKVYTLTDKRILVLSGITYKVLKDKQFEYKIEPIKLNVDYLSQTTTITISFKW